MGRKNRTASPIRLIIGAKIEWVENKQRRSMGKGGDNTRK